MEFAAAALSSIAGAASSAGSALVGAVTSVGSTLTSALTSTSGWASILSGGATVASVLAMQEAGETKAWNYQMQADDAELQARVEQVQGLDRRNSLKAALVQAVGERDVAAAASGVDLSFGTPAIARSEAIKDGERALSTDQATEDFRRQRLLERAGNLRLMAGQARSGALASSAALALEGGAKLLRRG